MTTLPPPQAPGNTRSQRRIELAVIVALFLVAAAIRLYGLDRWPPGLYNDEAANGVDAIAILRGNWPIFFERNYGREPLFIYLQTLSLGLFGATPYALRLTAAIAGAATAPALYWMTREAFARTRLPARWLAFWTASFLALSYWHISLSRIGLRAILVPLVAALAFAWFWRAWWKLEDGDASPARSARARLPWVDLVLCGLLVGVGLYTYTAARFIPLVIAVVALMGAAFGAAPSRQRTGRIVLATCVVGVTAAVVFAPLGWFFLTHPGTFFGRAASVSVTAAAPADGTPLSTLVEVTGQTIRMFFVAPDPNLRHNPAQRPVFDVVLALWLAAGIVCALVRWRALPYAFAIAWLVLLAAPAILAVEGVPHSLRAIGMLPVALLLAVLAMMAFGQRFLSRWRRLALLVPLPFLAFSGVTGLRDYFQAWQPGDKFAAEFQTEYVDLARWMAGATPADTVWLLPVSPTYRLADDRFYSMEFVAGDRFGSVPASESDAPARLAAATQGKQTARLIAPQSLADPAAQYVFGDPKHLIEFLLKKHGRLVSETVQGDRQLSYQTFALPASGRYPLADDFTALDVSFGNKIRLTEAAYGRTPLSPDDRPDALNEKAVTAGHALWAVLHWEALTPIGVDLKTSLVLKSASGAVVSQVDDLLVSDRYPLERVWEPGEPAGTYHILPVPADVEPGRYELVLKVYEDKTLTPYSIDPLGGDPGRFETPLGTIDVIR